MEQQETLREDKWLEEVFGPQSRLKNDEWVHKVSTSANWIFNVQDMRKRLFAEAKLTIRH